MRTTHLLAALRHLLLAAAVLAFPALAQQPKLNEFPAPVCANCHEAAFTTTAWTAHGGRNDANGTMCMACHGDATAHVKDPTKAKMTPKFTKNVPVAERDAVCLTCHSGSRHLAFWESGKHARNEVGCSNCHSIHAKPQNPHIGPLQTTFRPNEADLCGSCHQQIRAATYKPSHHPIIEGKMKCSDCHNPHGALSHAMVKQETVNAQCLSCHAQYRGPFVFGHIPVEDNCLSCHNPHGSPHARLLNEKVPNLCQDCHDWSRHPGSFYDGSKGWIVLEGTGGGGTPMPGTPGAFNPSVSTRFIARSCLNCHNAIHGSNAPGNRGKFFTR